MKLSSLLLILTTFNSSFLFSQSKTIADMDILDSRSWDTWMGGGKTIGNVVVLTSANTLKFIDISDKANPINISNCILPTDILNFEINCAQIIATCWNFNKSVYRAEFNANDLPSGVYFYRLQSGNYSNTKKMILLR